LVTLYAKLDPFRYEKIKYRRPHVVKYLQLFRQELPGFFLYLFSHWENVWKF